MCLQNVLWSLFPTSTVAHWNTPTKPKSFTFPPLTATRGTTSAPARTYLPCDVFYFLFSKLASKCMLPNKPRPSKIYNKVFPAARAVSLRHLHPPRHTHIQLYRVQNPSLYKQFAVQKAKVAKRLSQKWLRNVVTSRELFHGTSQTSSDCILKHGFDRSHAGVNGRQVFSGFFPWFKPACVSCIYLKELLSCLNDRFTFLD